MPAEPGTSETLWWVIKPPEPSRFARALHTMHIRKLPHGESTRDHISSSEVNTIADEELRKALGRQATSHSERFFVIPIANSDGSFSHSVRVPRGSLFDDRADFREDN